MTNDHPHYHEVRNDVELHRGMEVKPSVVALGQDTAILINITAENTMTTDLSLIDPDVAARVLRLVAGSLDTIPRS